MQCRAWTIGRARVSAGPGLDDGFSITAPRPGAANALPVPSSPWLNVPDYEIDQHLVEFTLLVGDGGRAP